MFKKDKQNEKYTRRDFLKKASLISLTGLIYPFCGDDKDKSTNKKLIQKITSPSKKNFEKVKETSRGLMKYKELGNTGIWVSDISFGAGQTDNPKVVLEAMERGINYFDTSPRYMKGVSEETLGKAFSKTKMQREKYIVSTKVRNYHGETEKEAVASIIQSVEESLKRLKVDYVDILFMHALKGKDDERLKNDYFWEACEKLKQQGKIRLQGVTSHFDDMSGCQYLLDKGLIEATMIGYNRDHSNGDEIKKYLVNCHEKGVATIAMKVERGQRKRKRGEPKKDLSDSEENRSKIKWMLKQPYIDTMVMSIKSLKHLKKYVSLSGSAR